MDLKNFGSLFILARWIAYVVFVFVAMYETSLGLALNAIAYAAIALALKPSDTTIEEL